MRDTEASIPPTVTPSHAIGSSRLALIGAAIAAAAAVVLALGFRADTQLSYDVSGASVQGGLIAAERGEATVTFSDGSSILAENQTRFSVDVVARNAALTRLVAGRLHVRVQHHEDTSYRFVAGPYEVRVVGTEFDLAWDPGGTGLTLSMSKGEVRLAEPSGALRTLRAGQSLHLPGALQTSRAPEPALQVGEQPTAPPHTL